MISAVSARGHMRFMLAKGRVKSSRQLGTPRPWRRARLGASVAVRTQLTHKTQCLESETRGSREN
jgi:hypothetical protein